MPPRRPTPADLRAAANRKVPDVIAPDLKVLFCGINPGLYSAAVGHHFARPGNRFWPTLHEARFTPRRFIPDDERELLALGYGITNLVARATGNASELSREELVAGLPRLLAKVRKYRPAWLAVVGVGAYRQAFDRPKAQIGLQSETIGQTRIWLLPNPSGLNAHYQLAGLAEEFRVLYDASAAGDASAAPAT